MQNGNATTQTLKEQIVTVHQGHRVKPWSYGNVDNTTQIIHNDLLATCYLLSGNSPCAEHDKLSFFFQIKCNMDIFFQSFFPSWLGCYWLCKRSLDSQ